MREEVLCCASTLLRPQHCTQVYSMENCRAIRIILETASISGVLKRQCFTLKDLVLPPTHMKEQRPVNICHVGEESGKVEFCISPGRSQFGRVKSTACQLFEHTSTTVRQPQVEKFDLKSTHPRGGHIRL
mmetsp:Transcript_123306/g.239872  ORF Transcript_123306/g.239872 Transcript_123306/m.239872 type:complete len:130 (-) Transcript_123306:369-758(-)